MNGLRLGLRRCRRFGCCGWVDVVVDRASGGRHGGGRRRAGRFGELVGGWRARRRRRIRMHGRGGCCVGGQLLVRYAGHEGLVNASTRVRHMERRRLLITKYRAQINNFILIKQNSCR